MPADVANFSKDLQKAFGRLSQIYIFTDDGTTQAWQHLGRIKNPEITMEPVVSEADSTGREQVLCFDVTASFVLMQTSTTELANISALAAPDATYYPNGHSLFFTDKPYDPSVVTATDNKTAPTDGASDLAGLGFVNTLPKPSPAIDGMGEESMITIEFTGRVFREAMDNLETDPMIVFDY